MLSMTCLAASVILPCSAQPDAGPTVAHMLADFEDESLDGWQSSISGEYYQGGHGQKGLSIADDAQRGGKVLEAKIRWTDDQASEPAFITFFLPEPIPAHLIASVSFAYHLSAYHLDDRVGFRVRLRYSESSFTDYPVSTGRPLPAGEWREATLDTRPGSNVRNVYGTLFGSVQELTFRLDDVDAENAEFALRVDDIRLDVRQPLATPYTPRISAHQENGRLDILYLKHSAEGFFPLEDAARFCAGAFPPTAEGAVPLAISTQLFRGLHFPFFDFPPRREQVLAYDLIVMLDVDPYVLTWDQATWIADAVASGAGLLFVAGPNTLQYSKDFKSPIGGLLPLTFDPGAEDLPGGPAEVAAPTHPVVAGLLPDRLGRVGAIAAVDPKADSQVVLTAGGRPLLILGDTGKGRVAVLTTSPQVAGTAEAQFYTDDCSLALLEQLVLWLTRRQPDVLVSEVTPPERTVTGEADVEFGLTLTSEQPRTVAVRWSADSEPEATDTQTVQVDGEARITHAFSLSPPQGPRRPVELRALVHDRGGRAIARRQFRTRVLSPIGVEGCVWHGNRAFAPGWPVRCAASLSIPGAPQLSASGAGASLSLPGTDLVIGLPTMADVWAYEPGTDSVYHSFSGGEVLRQDHRSEGLFPGITTEALLRATRTDGQVFDADNRIATVRRTLQARPDGVVACRYDYEFVRDVRVSRMPLLLTFPVGRFAGLPFSAAGADGTAAGVLPRDEDQQRDTIADLHGLDLTLDTEAGPVRVKWDAPELRAWLRDLRKYDIADYRLELESPFAGREARAGDKYSVEFEVHLPVSTPPLPSMDGLQVAATLKAGEDFATAQPVWDLGAKPADAEVDFAGELPNLESGRYWLEFALGKPGDPPLASTRSPAMS